ncbi:hypothetical protein BN59_01389 [Legionella massiliensis]|uniref:Uncharacterized protein n=1 Tax=Legionella massiliensis TaxID=1034943 RepID=A0A078KVS3_9GAMM|nr:hypothetical protein [Legionella massiliensis]CDZ77107.1 hypothetical protein BN59_01389 [Legionella massiliensis]CEE12845.1 hypothetical protein BN1094_01389 [Legionella massiliensis]
MLISGNKNFQTGDYMILGPFWCQRDNSWVRFIVENEKARAEVARISDEDHRLTTEWAPAATDNWPTSYEAGNPEVNTTFFALKDEKLYSTTGKITNLQGLSASQYRQPNWYPHNTARYNPFAGLQFEGEQNLRSPQNLPLTPEMLAAKIRQEQEQEEERIRREQEEAERIRLELENKWRAFQQTDIRHYGLVIAAGADPLMGEDALAFLYNELTGALLEFNVRDFENPAEYLQALKTIIEDSSNRFHQAIVRAASTTHVEREQGLVGDEGLRQALFDFKKLFFFNLLREEARFLSEQFKIACEILSIDVLAQREAEERALREQEQVQHQPVPYVPQIQPGDFLLGEFGANDQVHQQPIHEPVDDHEPVDNEVDELQRAIDLSFEEYEQAFYGAPINQAQANQQPVHDNDEDPDILLAIAASLQPENRVQHPQPDPDLERAIQESLAEQPQQRRGRQAGNRLRAANSLDLEGLPVDDNETLLARIQVAVDEAQKRYQEWYEDTNGTKEIRGKDGWFSRWFFRHNVSGQNAAKRLNSNVADALNVGTAADLVNEFLINAKAERHSYFSFLVDELKEIEDSVWFGISFKEGSNLYDKDLIVERLLGEDNSSGCCPW